MDYQEAVRRFIKAAADLSKANTALQEAARALPPGSAARPGYPAQVVRLLEAHLAAWRGDEPEAFGLPAPLSAAEERKAEAKRSLALAKKRLAWATAISRRVDRPEDWKGHVARITANVNFWQRRLDRLDGKPEPVWEVTTTELDTLAGRMNSYDAARRALGLPVAEPEPYPAMPK